MKKRLIKKEKIIHNLISSKEEIANNVEMMGKKIYLSQFLQYQLLTTSTDDGAFKFSIHSK